jgi:lytic murein transglycosylase
MPTRRQVCLSLATLAAGALTGCAEAAPDASSRPAVRPEPNPGWARWVAAFRPRAAAAGIPESVLEAAFQDAGYLPVVIERDRNQAEFRRSFEDYLQLVANEERVAQGRAAFASQRATLERIEARWGVPAEIVAAIWGVESRFGTRRGDIPVVSATSTLAYDGRRGRFFEQQLLAALRILASGDTTPDRMVGSWAGAMGHTQFIPTSFLGYAVDFTGDGRRDIWSDDPTDALASAAAYLARSGWRRGAAWSAEAGRPGAGSNTIRPDAGGPAFGTGPNFRVIKRYNNSDNYALAVGYLANRLAGEGPLRQGFGPDAAGLTLADRQELQRRLTAAGFDAGTPDGVIGSGTREAIAGYQASRGLAPTGEPSRALLEALGGT